MSPVLSERRINVRIFTTLRVRKAPEVANDNISASSAFTFCVRYVVDEMHSVGMILRTCKIRLFTFLGTYDVVENKVQRKIALFRSRARQTVCFTNDIFGGVCFLGGVLLPADLKIKKLFCLIRVAIDGDLLRVVVL